MNAVFSLVMSCLLAGLIIGSPCWGFDRPMIEEPDRTHVFQGHFDETPWGAFPMELVFSYEVMSPGGSIHDKFYLSAVTGEDAFELRHTWAKFAGFKAGRPSEEKLQVPFKANGEYPLPMKLLSFPNCPYKNPAVLKMIALEKNRLVYRIILPECLKAALKKEKEKETQP